MNNQPGSEPPRARQIAASVLRRPDGKVLLLKRAPTHATNPDKWCFVTGYVEVGEMPRKTAIRELSEELGIEAAPVHAGEVVEVRLSADSLLYVHPFLFEVGDIPITLDREHVEYVWIAPVELYQYDTVQQLDDDLKSLGLL